MSGMLEVLLAGAAELNLELPEGGAEKLCAFGRAVAEQNRVMNLTAITEPEQIARLHLLDSLTVCRALNLSGGKLIDVGCGAGFPGVPVAVACPNLQVTLLDAQAKRMRWLAATLPKLDISARCLVGRAEETAASCRERYDYAVSRAVARLNVLLELTAPYVRVGGAVAALKGGAAREELAEARSAIRKLGLTLEGSYPFPLVGEDHVVLVFRKTAPTPAVYPRRYAKIKQSPL